MQMEKGSFPFSCPRNKCMSAFRGKKHLLKPRPSYLIGLYERLQTLVTEV